VLAIENPASLPNNKFGIHILFTGELEDAAKLINSNGGDWGYVTIPIQSGEKDLEKWQKFMDDARNLHIIPIIRLASEGDFFNTRVWRKPNIYDILDFANFLNSLDWPTKNRYVIVFNETNRADEWGGKSNPSEYAQILSYAVTVFKSKSHDFFIISAGLDNAAENSNDSYNQYDYLRQMNSAVPGIFYQIDGIGSHSYPNPGFSQPPNVLTAKSISSFKFEKNLIQSLSSKDLPVFITETGWSHQKIKKELIGEYYKTAFSSVWNDASVVAVTPFLLKAGTDPFLQFSFIENDSSTPQYTAFQNIKKEEGRPGLTEKVLGEKMKSRPLETLSFNVESDVANDFSMSIPLKNFFKLLLGLR